MSAICITGGIKLDLDNHQTFVLRITDFLRLPFGAIQAMQSSLKLVKDHVSGFICLTNFPSRHFRM